MQTPMFGKRRYRLIGIIAFVGIALILIKSFQKAPVDTIRTTPFVETATVRWDSSNVKRSYSGEVRGYYEIPLAFQVGGKISKRHVNPGSIVRAGDLLLAINSQDIEQVVKIATAQLDAAGSKLKVAENTLNRSRELYQAAALSQDALEKAQDAYAGAEAALRLATAQHQQSLHQLRYCSLYAERDGVVTAVNVEVGQVVGAGTQAVTVSGEKEVEFSVPENQVDAFQQVNALKVGFWALPEVILDGKIREVAPSADKITRTYKVRVSLENPPPTVKLGMTAKVEAATSENAKVAVIPLTAVYQPGNSPQVWILQKDTVTLRPLKLGNYKENAVEVLDGLREGDIFVTAGVHKLQEGQMVNTAGDQP